MSVKQFIPSLIFFLVLGIVFATVELTKVHYRRKKRRSPFTEKFLRGPGQSLMDKLVDINLDINANMAMLLVTPVLFYATLISILYFTPTKPTMFLILMCAVSGIALSAYLLLKIVRLLGIRRTTRIGYDGEMAVGQELTLMMLQGYFVFHDFIADDFNIDHIVIGPAGVFAIETKTRTKPTSGNNKADAKVSYNGQFIQFPGWKEFKVLEQAKSQALWLERWLTSATGEKTLVRPVIALPGWYVERTSSNGIPVINPKLFKSIAKPLDGKTLTEGQITRINHQIEQHCRNLPVGEILGGTNHA